MFKDKKMEIYYTTFIKMPENFITMFDLDSTLLRNRKLEEAQKSIVRINEQIKDRQLHAFDKDYFIFAVWEHQSLMLIANVTHVAFVLKFAHIKIQNCIKEDQCGHNTAQSVWRVSVDVLKKQYNMEKVQGKREDIIIRC